MACRLGGIDHAALRGDHQHPSAEAVLAQIGRELGEIGLHHRLERRIDRGRGGTAVFAQGRVELMGEGIRHPRQMPLQQHAGAQLVRRIDDRPQQAHRDRFNPARAHRRDHREEPRVVERLGHRSVGDDPARHFPGQGAWDIGFGVGHAEVERFRPAAFAQHQDVGVAPGGQECGAGGVAGQDGVERVRGAVDEGIAAAEQRRQRLPEARGRGAECVQHALHRVGRRRRRLEHVQAAGVVLDDQIGEGATRIDCVAHPRPRAIESVDRARAAAPAITKRSLRPRLPGLQGHRRRSRSSALICDRTSPRLTA
jgi:hypothetical protein